MAGLSYIWVAALYAAITVIIISFVVRALLHRSDRKFRTIILNEAGYPSLAIFQFLLWTVVVAFSYLLVYYLRIYSGLYDPPSTISTNILILLGISTAVPIVSAGVNSVVYHEGKAKSETPKVHKWSSMLLENGKASLSRYQMFLWTWIGIGLYIVILFYTVTSPATVANPQLLDLPDIDPTLVVLMGLSQGAFIGGKLFPKEALQGGQEGREATRESYNSRDPHQEEKK
jgi:hypothetical protein